MAMNPSVDFSAWYMNKVLSQMAAPEMFKNYIGMNIDPNVNPQPLINPEAPEWMRRGPQGTPIEQYVPQPNVTPDDPYNPQPLINPPAPDWMKDRTETIPIEEQKNEPLFSEKPTLEEYVRGEAKHYHGTDANYNIKDIGDSKESWVSTNIGGNLKTTRHGIFLSDNPKFAEEFGENVFNLKANVKNTYPMNYNTKEDFADSIDSKKERKLWEEAKYSNHNWELFEGELGKRFVKFLKDKGYDSASFQEETGSGESLKESNTLVVLDKKNLKTKSQLTSEYESKYGK